MWAYFVKRFVGVAATLILVSIIVFFLIRLIPGDPARQIAGEQATAETIANVTRQWGLDQPIPIQYLKWVNGILHGDFGISYRSNQPVIKEITTRYGNTLKLTGVAILWSVLIGLLVGTFTAVHEGHWQDLLGVFLTVAGQAIPSFWLGLLLMYIFGVKLKLLPVSGAQSWKSLILPAFTLGTAFAASITRFTRSSMLECLKEDYTRAARAEGLSEHTVIWKHAFRNCLNPVVTAIGISIGDMLGGSVIIETVFGYPGIGYYLVNSIINRDYTAAQIVILIIAANYILINLLADIVQALLNPEICYR